jgi:hypothetical protein
LARWLADRVRDGAIRTALPLVLIALAGKLIL